CATAPPTAAWVGWAPPGPIRSRTRWRPRASRAQPGERGRTRAPPLTNRAEGSNARARANDTPGAGGVRVRPLRSQTCDTAVRGGLHNPPRATERDATHPGPAPGRGRALCGTRPVLPAPPLPPPGGRPGGGAGPERLLRPERKRHQARAPGRSLAP